MKEDNLVERVNMLVKTAFGSEVDGTWHPSTDAYIAGYHKDEAYLGSIGKSRFMTYFQCGVLNKDGSKIKVKKKWMKEAQTYAELYKAEFDKEAEIISVNIFGF
tara:strand:+ start:2910 stop:3221 length:312 start_codon:yes stop_codon:yes gene_type:complete